MPELTLDNTAFVLDSTCDPAPGFFDQPGFYLVPLTVHFGDQSYRDAVDLTHEEFYGKLVSSPVLPTTSQPTVAEFTAVYERATAQYEHVFSLHISSKMSGTFGAAERAAEAFTGVEAYDLRTVTCGLTMCALRLRARLESGLPLDEARAYIQRYRQNTKLLVHAGTLEYLRRGGRIGRAASLVGGVFDIKPLIQLVDGELTPYAKVRGLKKALAAIERYVDETTKPDDELYYCLIDAFNEEEPPLIRELIERMRPKAQLLCTTRVGAVVGTHIGPGSAAFAMIVE